MDILELAFSYRFRIPLVSHSPRKRFAKIYIFGETPPVRCAENFDLRTLDRRYTRTCSEYIFRILYVLMFGKFWPSIRILSPVHMAGQETQVFSSAVFWLGCLIIPFVTILRDVAYKV